MTSDQRPSKIRVVVSCTNRKCAPVPDNLRLRNIFGVNVEQRLATWIARITKASSAARPALGMYCGEHWDAVRRIQASASTSKRRIDLWVCSAGYGLISLDAPICPYAATFAAGSPDTVPNGIDGASEWWAALATWNGPNLGPRSLAQLAASDPSAGMLLVLSEVYLRACRADVLQALTQLDNAHLFSIISAGTKADSELGDFLLPVDARLQHVLGGTRQALNVRVAERVLTTGIDGRDATRDLLLSLLAAQPPIPRYNRRTVSDTQVRSFIRKRLRSEAETSHTRLLREFRDSGSACEQGRFAAIFRNEVGVYR